MNILYVAHPAEQHTAEYTHTIEVIENLRKLGHTVDVLPIGKSLVYNSALLAEQEKPLWVKALSHTPVKGLYRKLKGELALLGLARTELRLTVRLLRRARGHSALYSRHRWLNGAELLCSRLWRIPFIREVNGFVADEMVVRKAGDRLSVWLFGRIERWNLRRGDRWVAVTARIKATLCEEYGVTKEKVAVVENGVNTELFKPSNWASSPKQICFVGQLWEHQKLEPLIRAVLAIDVPLLLVGDGSKLEELRQLATKLCSVVPPHPTNYPTFLGRVQQDEVPDIINASALCVGPFTEGWYNKRIGRSALKLCEYLACGKPVVCSRTEGTEFIEEERLGILVDNLEPETIACAINTLLEYPELRLEMGRRARKYVVDNRSWEKAAERIAEAMEDACTCK